MSLLQEILSRAGSRAVDEAADVVIERLNGTRDRWKAILGSFGQPPPEAEVLSPDEPIPDAEDVTPPSPKDLFA